MDILSLSDTGENGAIVNGVKSATWIERYLAGGEFKIESEDPETIFSDLPIGTLVTHVDTSEIMIVEDHEVEQELGEPVKATVSGRGLDQVMMENRIVTRNGGTIFTRGLGVGANGRGYQLSGASTWHYAKWLIEAYLKTSVESAADNLLNFDVRSEISVSDATFKKYVFKDLETLYEAVNTLLAPDQLGIKIERPNEVHSTIDFVIHKGVDRRDSLQFSWFLGDIQKARYLWSSRDEKTAGFIYDNTVTTRRQPGVKTGIHARYGKWDASNLDLEFTYPLVNAELDAAYDLLLKRLDDEIAAAKRAQLIDAEIVKNPSLRYGVDYNMGDILMVLGDYGTTAPMRVTEYAITFDEDGINGYPTLSALDEEE